MLFIYRMVTSVVYFFIYPFASSKAKGGDSFWADRLGRYPSIEKSKQAIWIHAASVGEVRVATYLAKYLSEKSPDSPLVGTVQTRTGLKTAKENYPDQMKCHAMPLDAANSISRAFDQINPAILVITETEIWPNLLCEAFRRKIPLVLVNGRMSAKAFGQYKLFRSAFSYLLSRYARIFAKTKEDANHFSYFEVAQQNLTVAGDMKFDAPLTVQSPGRKAEIRYRLNAKENDFLFVAGSTRPGEEELLLQLIKNLKSEQKTLRLVIAPRHIERSDEIFKLCQSLGVSVSYYGDKSEASCIIVNEMGLLDDLYMAADLAFVGGTLVDIGGHNLLEPVWSGTPVLFGPSIFNVAESAGYIKVHNYGDDVQTVEELTEKVSDVMNGKLTFAIKTKSANFESPTVAAGEFILEQLSHV